MSRTLLARIVPANSIVALAAALAAAAFTAGCVQRETTPPDAEFLVATADSTFWVTSGRQGLRIRAVPMTLATYDGRFHEVFVADLDRSFDDAVFTGERVYVRDLQSNDSTLVYDDTAIVTMAAHHARAFPGATPLRPDDETPQEPRISAYGETDVLEVRGPYALLEHRTTYQMLAGSQHDTVQAAVDLRTGRAATREAMSRDSARDDSSVARTTPLSWARKGYTLDVRAAGDGSVLLALRDADHRSWQLLTVHEHPRVYWLDNPRISQEVRRALSKAFNSAASYDEAVKYASFTKPARRIAAPRVVGHA